jgi:hypothetical protein
LRSIIVRIKEAPPKKALDLRRRRNVRGRTHEGASAGPSAARADARNGDDPGADAGLLQDLGASWEFPNRIRIGSLCACAWSG